MERVVLVVLHLLTLFAINNLFLWMRLNKIHSRSYNHHPLPISALKFGSLSSVIENLIRPYFLTLVFGYIPNTLTCVSIVLLVFPPSSALLCRQENVVMPTIGNGLCTTMGMGLTVKRVVGFAITLLAAYLRSRAYHDLAENFTFNPAYPYTLITTGLYSYIRHPAYATVLLLCIGQHLIYFGDAGIVDACWLRHRHSQSKNDGLVQLQKWQMASGDNAGWILGSDPQGWWNEWLIFVGWAVPVWAWIWARIYTEEKAAKEKFGKDWIDWARSTPRLVPGIF
ncbi:MAG: hypothetical protein M1827_001205 [Pycnora praestabilis]|nr:MAG: hypothetical protein M1827_001205 [Pycnora praestabilis]